MQLNLSKLSWKVQIGIFVAVSGLLVGTFYYYWVEPMQAEMAIREQKLTAMQADIHKGRTTARQLPEFRRQVADLEQRLESLRAVLPEQKDVGDLLRRIQILAAQSNLQIKGFKPAPTVTRQMHAEWPIDLELDGTYHNLGRFLDEVAKFSRIINVGQLRIKAKDKPTVDSTVTAACVATTFVLFEPSSATPAPAARGRAPQRPAARGAKS
jgi:type IV pilus assembly protein PilO